MAGFALREPMRAVLLASLILLLAACAPGAHSGTSKHATVDHATWDEKGGGGGGGGSGGSGM